MTLDPFDFCVNLGRAVTGEAQPSQTTIKCFLVDGCLADAKHSKTNKQTNKTIKNKQKQCAFYLERGNAANLETF